MNKMVENEIETLIAEAKRVDPQIFSYGMLEGLPEPVQRYFRHVLKDGQPSIRFAKIKAAGAFRRPKSEQWSAFITREYVTTEHPGFVFEAVMKPNAFVWFDVRDKYHNGAGGMFINMFSGVNVLNESDVKELNATSFLRWAGEAVLFPTALLPSRYIQWEPLDKNSAKAILTDGNNKGEYRFYFNEIGEIIRYESADRYDKIDGIIQRVGSIALRSIYREINGIKIPTKFSITRILPDGTHEEFWKGEITEIQFNEFEKY
jgi:hypothetical protein